MKGFGLSDIGLVRERNEDSFLFIPPFLGIVADGMGGHQGGLEASEMAVMIAKNKLQPENQPPKGQFESWLAETMEYINLQIFSKSQEQQILSGMGTTLSIAYLSGNQMYWAHVGDSRIYLFRDGNLKQITKDHALASSKKKKSHILTRALGVSKNVIVDTGATPIFIKDQILLCSDGLHDVVEENLIKVILEKDGLSPKEKVNKMIEDANKKGSPDNITALIMLID